MHDALLQERYTSLAVLMHWAVAVLVFFQLGLGSYMEGPPKGTDWSAYFALHKSVGLTVFLLAALRLVWRATHPPPAAASPHSRNHKLLYVFMFLQPVSGYLSSSFSAYPPASSVSTAALGLEGAVPERAFQRYPRGERLTLAALVGVHVLAAVAYAVRPGDPLFRRMLPRSLVP